jgi:hypothetical protein
MSIDECAALPEDARGELVNGLLSEEEAEGDVPAGRR